jgi:hypothetical protein
VTAQDRQGALAYLVAAELLQSHDETGCSLDHWERAAPSSSCCSGKRSSITSCDEFKGRQLST